MGETRLLHPVVLASLAVLVLNDRVLKTQWPGVVSGKLSDLSGLVVVGALLLDVVEWRRARPWRHLVAAVVGLGIAFAVVKSFGFAAREIEGATQSLHDVLRAAVPGLPPAAAHVRTDATDLLVLPALAIPLALCRPARPVRAAPARS